MSAFLTKLCLKNESSQSSDDIFYVGVTTDVLPIISVKGSTKENDLTPLSNQINAYFLGNRPIRATTYIHGYTRFERKFFDIGHFSFILYSIVIGFYITFYDAEF